MLTLLFPGAGFPAAVPDAPARVTGSISNPVTATGSVSAVEVAVVEGEVGIP